MSLDFADLTRAVEDRDVENDSEVTFRRTRSSRQCALRAYISERMAILELCRGDDVALESRSCGDTEVAATRQREENVCPPGTVALVVWAGGGVPPL